MEGVGGLSRNGEKEGEVAVNHPDDSVVWSCVELHVGYVSGTGSCEGKPLIGREIYGYGSSVAGGCSPFLDTCGFTLGYCTIAGSHCTTGRAQPPQREHSTTAQREMDSCYSIQHTARMTTQNTVR